MQAKFECIPCLARQAVEAARIATDDLVQQEQIIREALRRMSQVQLDVTPLELGQVVHSAVRETSGVNDPYLEIKRRSTAEALEKYPEMKQIVSGADDPLTVATKIAITGNIIDFGVPNRLDVNATLDHIMQTPFAVDDFEWFAERITAAKRVLFLGDNAGEIVFDRVLIEELPAEEITLVVKNEPFINDALLEDAQAAGFDESVRIVAAPIYPATSEQVRAAWAGADVIVSKGQANYEAYSEADGPLFYLLVAKCDYVARELGVNIGDLVLKASDSGD